MGLTAKGSGKDNSWFKRVDKGRRLGRFILETPALQTGEVKARLDELKAAIYARPETTSQTQRKPGSEQAGV